MYQSNKAQDVGLWIKNNDYLAAFTRGGCFHFALFLKSQLGENYQIRGIRLCAKPTELSHVWVKGPGAEGIDIYGVFQENVTQAIASKNIPCSEPENVDVATAKAKACLFEKQLTPEITGKLMKLAHHVFLTHDRFDSVRPRSAEKQKAIDDFCSDSMEKKAAAT